MYDDQFGDDQKTALIPITEVNWCPSLIPVAILFLTEQVSQVNKHYHVFLLCFFSFQVRRSALIFLPAL